MIQVPLRLTVTIILMRYIVYASSVNTGWRNKIYPEGTNITLQCAISDRNNSTTLWLDEQQNIIIFTGEFRNTTESKFKNFEVSKIWGDKSLHIHNANVSDEGNYTCREDDKSESFGVQIEAVPILDMYVNNVQVTDIKYERISVPFADLIFIRCMALRAKPAVGLELKLGEREWIQPANVTYLQDGFYTNTEANFSFNVTSRNETEVMCKTSGGISITPVITRVTIDVVYLPICTLQRMEDEVICQCDANPPVNQYKIIVNEKLEASGRRLEIDPNASANVTCFASNNIGTGKSTFFFVSDDEAIPYSQIKRLAVLTVIVVAVPCITGTLFWYLQRNKMKRRGLKKSTNHCTYESRQNSYPAEEVALPMLPENEAESAQAEAEHVL
ncbi:hypothetical protein HOLleu_22248 [Holothuria leucospilota]|uniref:Ig-like domain-containing protein n=1 Tax=Holothuria leucospilota TaxID=206669 RepID=A0A9Q1BYS6_HOLLE|nr:hypothetical protein HOLleu_22248 [Holothuria leucospilota]